MNRCRHKNTLESTSVGRKVLKLMVLVVVLALFLALSCYLFYQKIPANTAEIYFKGAFLEHSTHHEPT